MYEYIFLIFKNDAEKIWKYITFNIVNYQDFSWINKYLMHGYQIAKQYIPFYDWILTLFRWLAAAQMI